MQTYKGHCHCGAVQFTATLDLEKPVTRCNCSYCTMRGWLLTFVPAEQFTLIAGGDNLTEYTFNTGKITHLFCKTCGMQAFGRGKGHDGTTDMVAVNANCLEGVDPTKLTVTNFNGKDL